eukprot:jgi/Picre1/29769/NNA_005151.t1
MIILEAERVSVRMVVTSNTCISPEGSTTCYHGREGWDSSITSAKYSSEISQCALLLREEYWCLVLAIGLLKQGISVKVLERDLTAIRGEGKYRGPIQVQSNALAALQALDDEQQQSKCSTMWYCKFDTFHPAVNKGLPVTRVISRQVLQEILAERVMSLGGEAVIENGVHVVDYRQEVDRDRGKRLWLQFVKMELSILGTFWLVPTGFGQRFVTR